MRNMISGIDLISGILSSNRIAIFAALAIAPTRMAFALKGVYFTKTQSS